MKAFILMKTKTTSNEKQIKTENTKETKSLTTIPLRGPFTWKVTHGDKKKKKKETRGRGRCLSGHRKTNYYGVCLNKLVHRGMVKKSNLKLGYKYS
jgi:hypothetical protein